MQAQKISSDPKVCLSCFLLIDICASLVHINILNVHGDFGLFARISFVKCIRQLDHLAEIVHACTHAGQSKRVLKGR